MAVNGVSSTFVSPNYTLDTFKEASELQASDVQNVQEWKNLKATGQTNTDRYKELTTLLADKIITALDWNKLLDAMYNLEKAYKDKGLNEIETTLADYVENNASQDIQNKIGTIINNLLLTNATKIIISTTQPTVEDGALWIKPKTT
nr:MAG TPA: hypothetical protein [Caudoviricetes sp.]